MQGTRPWPAHSGRGWFAATTPYLQALKKDIRAGVEAWNDNSMPLIWTEANQSGGSANRA